MKATALLVDDEEIVRCGLRRRLPWAKLGIELVGTAGNGREALAMLRSHPIDIVLTDIVMPELDGLQLIERARRLPDPPTFIVLSGYDEFSFAQRAMRLGVRQYVLKPTRLPELVRVLGEAAERVTRERRVRQQAARRQRILAEARPMARVGALAKAIADPRLGVADLGAIGRCLGVRPDSDCFSLVLVQAGAWAPAHVVDIEVLAGRILGAGAVVGGVESDGHVCLVVRCDGLPPGNDSLDELCARIERLGRTAVHAVCTEPSSLAGLARRYVAARSCLKRSFYLESGRSIRCSDAPAAFSKQPPPGLADLLRRVRDAVEAADAPALREPLAAAFALAGESMLDPGELRTACMGLLVGLADQLGRDAWEPMRASVPRIAEAPGARDLEDEVRSCLVGIVAAIRPLSRSPTQRMAEALKDAVHRRFSEHGLSLKKLCATVVFTNEDYAGRVFRAATGARFSEYLAGARMQEARRLLGTFPNMRVAEVARRTGYGDNAQYFCTAFRRCCGMTPNEYRHAPVKRTNSTES